jgi:hypothetical protein
LLSLENSTFTGNTTVGNGSALISDALNTTLRHVTITGNQSTGGAGAVTVWK